VLADVTPAIGQIMRARVAMSGASGVTGARRAKTPLRLP
jgi:hypothetical protein